MDKITRAAEVKQARREFRERLRGQRRSTNFRDAGFGEVGPPATKLPMDAPGDDDRTTSKYERFFDRFGVHARWRGRR